MQLAWIRKPDGDHNGRPIYEYHAVSGPRRYAIVWAYDAGFGYSARSDDDPLTRLSGLHWAHTLKRCKEKCQDIENIACNSDSGIV